MQVQSSVRRRLTRATGHGLMMDGLAMLGQPRGESRAERCAECRAATVTLRLTGATASSRQGRRHAWPPSKLSSASCAAHACTGRAVTVTGRHGPSRAEPLYGRARRLVETCMPQSGARVSGSWRLRASGARAMGAPPRGGRPSILGGPPPGSFRAPAADVSKFHSTNACHPAGAFECASCEAGAAWACRRERQTGWRAPAVCGTRQADQASRRAQLARSSVTSRSCRYRAAFAAPSAPRLCSCRRRACPGLGLASTCCPRRPARSRSTASPAS